MVGLVIFSLIPHLLVTADNSDKFLHAFAYCFVTITPILTLKSFRLRAISATLLLITGIINEFLQGQIGGRSPSVEDALANAGGIILGIFVSYLLYTGWTAQPQK